MAEPLPTPPTIHVEETPREVVVPVAEVIPEPVIADDLDVPTFLRRQAQKA